MVTCDTCRKGKPPHVGMGAPMSLYCWKTKSLVHPDWERECGFYRERK